jgi:hypothetical protein
MESNVVADPGPRPNYQALKNKYLGLKYNDYEAIIKKVDRPSGLEEIRQAVKWFMVPEDAMKLGDVMNQRLNELSDRLISFADFMRAYKSAAAGFMAMRDRCVKSGNDWVCASYMSQVEYFINSQSKDNSTGGRGPLNDQLGMAREGYELVKLIEYKWKEYKQKGEKDQLPGYEEEELKDLFKGLLAKQIGIDRFWKVMDIRAQVEGKPPITPANKKELIELWARHGILFDGPSHKHIEKPEEVVMPAPPAAGPVEPISTEEIKQVIKTEEDIERRIEELTKKKEELRQREKERQEKAGKPPQQPPTAPATPPSAAVSPELDLMQDEIRKRIAEMMRKKRAGEGMVGESAVTYGDKKKDYSYTELHFLINTCQDADKLRELHRQVDTFTITDFDKEILKEEISQRIQVILEHEGALTPGAGEKFAEGGTSYNEKDEEIIKTIKKEQGNLKGLKCTTIKSFHKPGYTVVVMKPYQEGEGLGSMGAISLYDINFKQESSAKRLEAKLKSLFKEESGGIKESLSEYLKKVSELKGEKLKMSNPVTRALYEEYSVYAGHWLSLQEFEDKIRSSSRGILSKYTQKEAGVFYNVKDIKAIKQAALNGMAKIWVMSDGREGLILASKYGDEWWEKAGQEDIERVTVYEQGVVYWVTGTDKEELAIVEKNLINVGYDLRNDGRGHMVLPNGKGVSPTNHRGIVNHWEVIVDAGYLPVSNISKLQHNPNEIIAGAINKNWRRWSGDAGYEVRDLSKSNADFINTRLKRYYENNGLHSATIDIWSEGKAYHFDKAIWDKSNHDILQVVKKVAPQMYHPAKAMTLELVVGDSGEYDWAKYLYQQIATPKKLDLSASIIRKRYTGIVHPNVEVLDIGEVLARADINYTPEEYPTEQPYIDNRLIPHMKTTKLSFPVIEIYTRDAVDNQRPHLPSGKRPFTDIHIIDGAHRIVALKKMGINKIPFVVYREPKEDITVNGVAESGNEDVQNFIDEARKYKSAEEFINSQKVIGYDSDFRTKLLRGGGADRRLDVSPDRVYIFKENKIPIDAKEIIIYRSAPSDIRPGDFVGLNENTAKLHIRNKNDKIWKRKVSVSDLIQGADQYEAIYVPKKSVVTVQQLTDIYREAHKKPTHQYAEKVYYTSSAHTMTLKQFIETEVQERGNYSLQDVKAWQQKYKISNTARMIWVSPKKWVANRYNLPADEWDEAENVPESEMSVYKIKASEGTLIIESDDGDEGFLFVFNTQKPNIIAEPAGEGAGQYQVKKSGGEMEVREDDLFKDDKEDCKQWDFGDWESLIPGMEDYDDLEEMLDCMNNSDKLSDSEKGVLRELIEKRSTKLRQEAAR